MWRAYRIGASVLFLTVVLTMVVLGVLQLTQPPTDDEAVLVTGGELQTNETAAWQWTQDRMGREANVTPWITIANHSDVDVSSGGGLETFERMLVGEPPDDESYPLAFAHPPDRVSIHHEAIPEEWNRSTRTRIDEMLVHEFAHLVQWESDALRRSRERLGESPGAGMALTAITEGSATYLAEAYTNGTTTRSYRESWRDDETSVHERYRLWPYVRGAAYVEGEISGPDDFEPLYANPPEREVSVLRGQAPGSDRSDRTVREELAGYVVTDRSSAGAAFVDSTLASSLGVDRSREVAAGLRSDRVVRIGSVGEGTPYQWVWITEWNASDTADAFATGMEGYLDDRWSRTNGTWTVENGHSGELERADATTVAITVGPDQFVANSTVRTGDDAFVLTFPGANDTAQSVTDEQTTQPVARVAV